MYAVNTILPYAKLLAGAFALSWSLTLGVFGEWGLLTAGLFLLSSALIASTYVSLFSARPRRRRTTAPRGGVPPVVKIYPDCLDPAVQPC